MTKRAGMLLCLMFLGLQGAPGIVRAGSSPKPGAGDAVFQSEIRPLFGKYCFGCHGEKKKGDLDLRVYQNEASVLRDRKVFEKVIKNLHAHEMPPEKKPQPTPEERELITTWVESEIFKCDCDHPDPGRVTIRRLNRAEYNNTIRDLIGVDFQPADDFPSDDSGYGFDNIGDVLSLPPVLMEKYLAAATRVLDEAIPTELPKSRTRHFNANLMEMGFNAVGDRGDGWMPLSALEEDRVAAAINVPAGDYLVRVMAYPRARGGEPLKLSLMLDNAVIHDWDVTSTEENP